MEAQTITCPNCGASTSNFMNEEEIFRQNVHKAIEDYHNKVWQRVYAAIESASELIDLNKEIEFDCQKMEILAFGSRVSIVFDGRIYALMSHVDCKIFSPRLTRKDIYEDFINVENNNG